MNKFKLSALLLGLTLLVGCTDQGDRIPGKCGVSEGNPNLVVGYNNEQCKESVSARFNMTLLKGEGTASIPSGDEAATETQKDIDADPSHLKLQQQANTTTSIAKFSWVTSLWFVSAFILLFTLARILLSRAVEEKDQYETDKPRYRFMSYWLPIIGVIAMLPVTYKGDDAYSYSTVSTYYPILKIMWGNSLEASTASSYLANDQKGQLGGVLGEKTRIYDPSYANARSIAYAQVNAQQLDNLTAKHYYKLNNQLVPPSQRQVEFQEPFAYFFDGNTVSIRRLEVGSVRQDQTISEVATMNIKESYSLNPTVKSDAGSLRAQYTTTESGQQQTMLAGFKAALMNKVGVDKGNADINNAVTAQSNEIVKAIFLEEMRNQTLIRMTARLNEEIMCISESQLAGKTYVKDIETYIKFLNGTTDLYQYDGAIECVGGKQGAFKLYGSRDMATVTNERNTAFKQLVDHNYEIIGNQATALSNVTIDETNGSACVKARKGLSTDFARYYPQCLRESSANRQIINMTAGNFTMTGNGEGNYVDTNYLLKRNSQSDSMMIRSFDTIMTEMYNSVEVKVEFRETNKEAYLETLITGNLGDVNSLTDTIMFIINPATSFKRDLGWTDECKGSMYRCIKSENVIPALQNVSEKMIDSGFYIATFSLSASILSSKFKKADDKSLSLDGKEKKHSSVKQKLLKVVEFLFSIFSTYGYWMFYIGWLIAYILAVIPLFFVIVGLLILIYLLFSIFLSVFRFMWMLFPNDKNNITMNFRKMANEFIYDVSIKSVLIIVQVFFYKALGWALKVVCFYMLTFMEQGVTEAIFGSILLAPVCYFVIIGMLQGVIKLLDAYAERLGGNSLLAEIMSDSLQLCLIVITFGLPLLFIRINRAVRRRR